MSWGTLGPPGHRGVEPGRHDQSCSWNAHLSEPAQEVAFERTSPFITALSRITAERTKERTRDVSTSQGGFYLDIEKTAWSPVFTVFMTGSA